MCALLFNLIYMDDFGAYQVASGIQNLSNQIGQDKENDKAREYNSEEAVKSRDYNTWLLKNQVQLKAKDYRQAGLNPAFMNGSILGATPSPSASPTSPNTVYTPDPNYLLSSKLLESEVKKTEAEAEKTTVETDKTKIETQYLPALLQSQIKLNDSHFELNVSGAHLNDEEAKEVGERCAKMQTECAEIDARMNMMHREAQILDEKLKQEKIQTFFKSDECKAIIANYMAQAKLAYTEAEDIVKTFAFRAWNMSSQAELNEEMQHKVRWDAASGELKFHLDEKFGSKERMLGIINGSVDALESVTNSMKNLSEAGKNAIESVDKLTPTKKITGFMK